MPANDERQARFDQYSPVQACSGKNTTVERERGRDPDGSRAQSLLKLCGRREHAHRSAPSWAQRLPHQKKMPQPHMTWPTTNPSAVLQRKWSGRLQRRPHSPVTFQHVVAEHTVSVHPMHGLRKIRLVSYLYCLPVLHCFDWSL